MAKLSDCGSEPPDRISDLAQIFVFDARNDIASRLNQFEIKRDPFRPSEFMII